MKISTFFVFNYGPINKIYGYSNKSGEAWFTYQSCATKRDR